MIADAKPYFCVSRGLVTTAGAVGTAVACSQLVVACEGRVFCCVNQSGF